MSVCAAGKDGKAQAPWSPSHLNEKTETQFTLYFVLISTPSAPASPSTKSGRREIFPWAYFGV